jgi:RNA polymerase sigma-70 factor (ECF subfamily)
VTDELEEWLKECYPKAYRTAFLILRNRADAEEAVQDAFLRAWRSRQTLHDVNQLHSWLNRIVVNTCCSKLRSELRHRQRRSGDDQLDVVADSKPSPEDDADRAEEAGSVRAALEALPDTLRVPVVLRYYLGLTEQEIADAIGRRPGTVKSRLHEARRILARDAGLYGLAHEGAL